MRIKIAKNAGFCSGVRNAVNLALTNASDNVYVLGELIHNEYVNNNLREKGIITADSIDMIPDNVTVIIRSHGVGKDIIDTLAAKNCNIINATCTYVNKIHDIVSNHHRDGDKIIIIGKHDHPEVQGINGWCDYSAIIISDITDIPPLEEGKYCVVVQTTYDFKAYEQIVQILKNNIKIVAIYQTICYTTKVRQEEALSLANECNIMLIIGSNKSANTKKLYDICKSICPRSYMILDKSELSSIEFKNNDIVGVTAGASTPKELMMEVINTMDNQQEVMAEIKDEVATEITPETATATPTTEAGTVIAAEDKKPLKKDNDDITMVDVMNRKQAKLREGMRVKGTIIKASAEGIYVNINQPKDGFIEKDEVDLEEYNPSDYNRDDEIEAIVILGTSTGKEYIALSKKKLDVVKKEDLETEKVLKGSEFSLACNEVVKGGLVGKMGSYTVFVPASELKMGYVTDLEQFKGKPLRLRAIPEKEKAVDDTKKRRTNTKRIVASQRIILAEEKAAKEEHFWSEMIPGNIVEGKVKRYAPFGVFVQVMSFDCLVHISDVSWTKIDDPSTVLALNETYEFEILKADREKGRVSLSYKSLQKTPYEIAAINYPVGTIIKGTVDRLATFGAFIRIEDGVDGLVHVSQISHEWIKDASQALKVGQEVEAKVIKFEDNKITLSIKELMPEPVQTEESEKTEQVVEQKEGKFKRSKKTREESKSKAPSMDEFREWVGQEDAVTIGDLFAGLKDIVPGDEDKE